MLSRGRCFRCLIADANINNHYTSKKMTDEKHVETEEAASGRDYTDQPEGTDWYLGWIVGNAEQYGLEQGVTLTIGGNFVTGTLISGRKYFEEIGNLMRSASGDLSEEVREGLGDIYGRFKEFYPEATGEDLPDYRFSYIHLRNARIFENGRPLPTDRGFLWRGKLSAVDGFAIGSLDPN